jgi:hypothetical protein
LTEQKRSPGVKRLSLFLKKKQNMGVKSVDLMITMGHKPPIRRVINTRPENGEDNRPGAQKIINK